MTRVKPGERKRTRAPKVRTGCLTCKIRRVKCDEKQPSCMRCMSTGRVCDGYPPPPDDLALVRIRTTLGTGPEVRSLQFFTEETLKQLQVFFPDDLWGSCMLHMAHTESSIRHALVALSCYHERYVQRLAPETDLPFALSQYNLAIKHLVAGPGEQSPHLNLISCLIFICIEILQGKHPSAIGLYRYGYGMLRELRRRTRDRRRKSKTDLDRFIHLVEVCLHRLGVQIFSLIGDVSPDMAPPVILEYLRSDMPEIPLLQSFADAREALLELVLEQFEVPSMDVLQHSAYLNRLENWSFEFGSFIRLRERKAPFTAAERRTIALLELHREHIELNLSNFTPGYNGRDLMMWDDFQDKYTRIVELAAITAGCDDNYSEKPQFHMDFGIIAPLLSVCGKCRDPLTRRKAVLLMASVDIQEGIFSSDLCSRVAARAVALEEAGRDIKSCRDVTVETRLTALNVETGPGDRQSTIHYTFPYGRIDEVLEW